MGEIVLRGITWDHPRGAGPLRASVEVYAQKTGVRVHWEARSLKDFGDARLEALAAEYDLLIVDHPHVGEAAESGCLLPLDEWLPPAALDTLAQQSAGPSHASYTYAGHQWALAIDAAMQASAYRPDLLESPLPATWDEALALGERLRAAGLWMAIPLVPTDCICSFLSLCASLGDPPGENPDLVAEEAGLAALDWLVRAAALSHPDSLNWNPIRMLDHMSHADDVAYCPLTFCYTNYARDGYAPHLVLFADAPCRSGALLGGAGFAVSARCAQPRAAVEYGAWLCSAEVQRTLYLEHGGQPGNAAAWDDDAANALTHDFFRATRRTVERAYVRPRFSGFVTFQEQAGHLIHGLLRGEGTVAECLARLRALYRTQIAG